MKKFVSVSMSRVKDGRGLGTAKGEDLSYYSNRLSGQLSLRKRKIKIRKYAHFAGTDKGSKFQSKMPEIKSLNYQRCAAIRDMHESIGMYFPNTRVEISPRTMRWRRSMGSCNSATSPAAIPMAE